MSRDAGYPGNLLKQDQLNSPHGGEGARNFGGAAWDFLDGWVRDIADWFLQHLRRDADITGVLVQDSVVVGDCIGMDLSRSINGRAWVGKMTSITSGNGVFIGIALEAVTAGLRCQVASHGPIAANFTLLNPALLAAGKVPVAVDDPGTNRLRVATVSDDVVGLSDPSGNVMLFAPGRVATLV